MTAKVYDLSKAQAAKMPGWHSWRHATRDAQDAAKVDYKSKRGRSARRRRVLARETSGVQANGGE